MADPKVVIHISGDPAGAQRAIDGVNKSLGSMGKNAAGAIAGNLKTFGAVALGAFGAAAAGAGIAAGLFITKAIPAASNLNEAMNASSVVFGDAAQAIQDFGRVAADTTGLSAEEFNQMGAEIGSLLLNFGYDADGAADSTIGLAQRAADMASIFNTDVSEALFAVQAGLRGETEPLRRFGVNLSDAAIKAYALENGMGEISKQTDGLAYAMATEQLILEQTNRIAGDFVNTSDQLANSTRVNQARWKNFMADLGQVGLPIMTAIQGVIADVGERVFPILIEAFESARPVVEGIAEAIGTFAGNLLAGVGPVDSIKSLIYDLGAAFGTNREQVDALVMGFQGIIDMIQGIIDAVSPYLEMAKQWISQNVELNDVLIGLGVAIGTLIIPLIISLISAVAPVILTFAAVVAIVALLRNAWESNFLGIQGITNSVISWVRDFINKTLTQIREWWAANGDQIVASVTTAYTNVRTFIDNFINAAKNLINTFLETVRSWWNEHGQAIIDIVNWFWGRVESDFQRFSDLVKGIVDAVTAAIKWVWENFGEDIKTAAVNFWEFIKTTFQNQLDFIGGIVDAAAALIKGDWEGFGKGLKDAADAFWKQIQNVWDTALTNWKNVTQTALELIKGWFDEQLAEIKSFVQPVVDTWNGFVNAVKNFWTWLTGRVFSFKIDLPKLPDWATPGSPLPIHTAWAEFAKDLSKTIGPQVNMAGASSMMAMATAGNRYNTYYLTAQYAQSETNLVNDVRLLELMYG